MEVKNILANHKKVTKIYIFGFLPQLLLSLSNGIINKVATVAGMEVMHRLSNMEFHPLRLTWLKPLLSAQVVRSRDH